ncbi:LacI family DNA-binding transcriptional regulator [Lactiplantibacillus paraplantarum]|uniref:LacI family DNA-binding transcriptional regulator n=1 Tax=Lactiplantibacillus paraplantarum TaxID=60520 RepID=UPI002074037E|nr:LacI family DNA-binding transcriptional regulator [Lactiplantibacillus paraplantarum]
MGIKISDIAQLAGVSKSAVSLALNEKPGISISTRKKSLKLLINKAIHHCAKSVRIFKTI